MLRVVVGHVGYGSYNIRHYTTGKARNLMADNQGIEPIFISVKEAAQALGISLWSCYQLLDDEKRPVDSRYKGSRRLVSVKSLRDYAETLSTERESA